MSMTEILIQIGKPTPSVIADLSILRQRRRYHKQIIPLIKQVQVELKMQ